MIRLPRDITDRDVYQWLANTVFLFDNGRRRVPAILYSPPEGLDGPQFGRDMESGDRTLAVMCGPSYRTAEYAKLTELHCYWPLGGSINVPEVKAAVHVWRKAAKQYRRSVFSGLLSFEIPKEAELRQRIGEWRVNGLTRLTPVTVAAMFDPVYWTVTEALDKLDNGWHSVAVNPRVIVAGGKHGKRMVYYQGDFVGTADFNTFYPQCNKLTTGLLTRAFEGVLTCQNL